MAYLKSMREWQKKYGMDYLTKLEEVEKMAIMGQSFSENGITLEFETIEKEGILFVHSKLIHTSGETIFTINRLPEYVYDCTGMELAACKIASAIRGTHDVFCEYMEELGYKKGNLL